jgi:hypothetical protein
MLRRTTPLAPAPSLASTARRRSLARLTRLLVASGGAAVLAFATASDALAKNDKWPLPESAGAAEAADPQYWPDDPGWGYDNNPDTGKRKKGQWHLYGFQPARSPKAQPLRPEEIDKPSGSSVDLAWRLSIGDPGVLLAVIDSGIKWEASDIINKAYLNLGELAAHKPKTAAGEACGGDGPLAGFDCNGDGVVNVADYLDDPDLTPDATTEGGAMFPRGDRNHNGVLDAGDLILNFSDGVDDDGNGYVDDISGWDFMKNDNDPYDDTRYGHGTHEAEYSTAEANNGKGDAGVCPNCRFIPLRAGDSFIANVQDFSKAVVYAADNGASVVQEALGTINNSSYTQAALEYAWKHNVLIVASMADENSRHHNMPGVNNYTFPVHVITNDNSNSDPTIATSMLAFNTCSNYGAQNYMSMPDDTCSSEATAHAAGMAGLIYSAARKYKVEGLSAGEAMQLFLMTADDIDVPESHDAKSRFFWSQKGFDQRFGYGRANAGRALEWVRDGKIPPDVNVTSPLWFENFYKAQLKGPVDVVGTVSAKRAQSYDYLVEWAPGVEPLDEAFTVINEVKNIDGQVVSGEGAPLAQLDVASIDTTHTPDRDSPNGENQFTITVRVRSVAHYGGDIGDVPGELRRAYQVQTDPEILPGFPLRIGASGESSPKLYDIDGDGKKDIVLADADGNIHAWKATDPPQELPGFPFRVKRLDGLEEAPLTPGTTSYLAAPAYATKGVDPDLARESFVGTAAVGDIDGDGKPEIAATTWDGTTYVVQSDGTVRPGWPRRMPDVPSCPLDPTIPRPDVCMDTTHILARGAFASAVLADMNGDGKLDVIQAGFDGHVYVYGPDGEQLPGWPVPIHYPGGLVEAKEYNRILSTPAVADVDGDGIPDVLVGSNEKLSKDAGGYYIVNGKGMTTPGAQPGVPPTFPNWPVTITSINIFPLVSEGVTAAGAFGDFDGDGKPEAVYHGNATTPSIVAIDPGKQKNLGGTAPNQLPERIDANNGNPVRGLVPSNIFGEFSKATTPDTMLPLFAQPSIGDLDMDGTLDVTTSGGSLSFVGALAAKGGSAAKPGQQLLGMWSGKTGEPMPGGPVPIEDYTFFNNQTIADITGDGFPEVFTGSGGYLVHAVDACGREAPGWPKNTGHWVIATVALGDIDGDGKLEAVVTSRDGWMFAWHTEGKTDGVIQWDSFHHDSQNTGNYATKLDQGTPFKEGLKLDCGALPQPDGGAAGASGAAGSSASDSTSPDGSLESEGGCSLVHASRSTPGFPGFAAAGGLLALALAGLRRSSNRRSSARKS